jgi:xanthine dehydrogenase YagS FAD-binding subunit
MQAFEYARPTTKDEAVRLLSGANGSAVVLAGGTDLLSLMKDHIVSPQRVVSLKHVKELHGIEFTHASGLRLGAMATFEELLDVKMMAPYPALLQAAEGVSSPQVRSTGTVGGDLCQRPRCWYYRSGFGLLAIHFDKRILGHHDLAAHFEIGAESHFFQRC